MSIWRLKGKVSSTGIHILTGQIGPGTLLLQHLSKVAIIQPLPFRLLSLMLRAKQVVYGFDGVKGFDGDFYEDRVLVTHRTVPQARQLQRFQLAAILALIRDEARILVDVVR